MNPSLITIITGYSPTSSSFGTFSLTLLVIVFDTLMTSLVTSTVEHPKTDNDRIRLFLFLSLVKKKILTL